MRDPHVERLHYRISSAASIRYDDPESTTFQNPLGKFDLANEGLVISPNEHFADEAQARAAIEPFLESWEIETDLLSQVRSIRFHFERADIVERNPRNPGEPETFSVEPGSYVLVGKDITMILTRKKYPDPPATFTTTPDLLMAHRRWLAFKDGREPLPAMAYFVLTILEYAAGGRPQAAATYAIEKFILDNVGRLTSAKGDPGTARKAEAASNALTDRERQWLENVTKKLIYRLGEQASGKPITKLRMQDLPPI